MPRATGAFNTPLATLHKFNGWADKFLTTPADGLTDSLCQSRRQRSGDSPCSAFTTTSPPTPVALRGAASSMLSVVYTAPWKQKFAIEAAFYDADDWATDTDKIWLWTQWGF